VFARGFRAAAANRNRARRPERRRDDDAIEEQSAAADRCGNCRPLQLPAFAAVRRTASCRSIHNLGKTVRRAMTLIKTASRLGAYTWASPNTLIGLALGLAVLPFGGKVR